MIMSATLSFFVIIVNPPNHEGTECNSNSNTKLVSLTLPFNSSFCISLSPFHSLTLSLYDMFSLYDISLTFQSIERQE